jgi:hypothetical protein
MGYLYEACDNYQISAINSCWEKCDEKCAYMFNVYKNQLSRQTGSRNLTGPKNASHNMAYLYKERFWTHQIPTSCLPTFLFYTHRTYMYMYMLIFHRVFLSNYWWPKSDIWSHASYRYPISWEGFWTHQIPTSCLPTLLVFIHIEHLCGGIISEN